MEDKKYAFYSYGRTKEFSDYYFLQNFWYSLEELALAPNDCLFFNDVGNSLKQKELMFSMLANIKCIVIPSYDHLNPSRTLFKELYEDRIHREGIYIICLDEEGYWRECI
ncbi:hypothetical protein [Ornithinibacillus halophilus]|uniref:Uncharacterized protein n=1 Tax=Ornithinibacillus halophilus TaxID=930117 RepID=A0A1M5G1M2_9BACI|nr:hypothetical protein [Ornithinibacillus halophilus]SHF97727.1 hypothetical protein SAMN05216225_101131 [Ornithinibacillus halophilus]